ncbi:hypothetical protein E2C01_100407 [Portunus trituberculatus]|uniref:Uncharacterized protein n=1 Tax=Portunus trituberculatus TaxID=210409 RepID=A0A5B7KD95_PORTR|nr:hypothetical protein [Portunus trituberculatus]
MPRASILVVPRSLKPLLQQARPTITKQQQAITTLQADMAALHTCGNEAPTPQVHPPAALEKCNLEMMLTAFRSWRPRRGCRIHLRRVEGPNTTGTVRRYR